MEHTLEKHKFFPYIAWTTVIAFAVFTYSLATNLQTSFDTLDEKARYQEQVLSESNPNLLIPEE